jgi:FkbH-like protein
MNINLRTSDKLRDVVDREFLDARVRFARTPTLLNAHKLLAVYRVDDGKSCIRRWRVFVTRSFTIEPILPLLRAFGFMADLDLQIDVGGFNTVWQDLLDGNSELYATNADAVLVSTRTADLCPKLWQGFSGVDRTAVAGNREELIKRFADAVSFFRSRSSAALVLSNLDIPAYPADGLQDAHDPDGQAGSILQINRALVEIARRHVGIYLFDYDGIVARHGRTRWYSDALDKAVGLPLATDAMALLAQHQARLVAAAAGQLSKVLAVDLDNTLWGGIVGEDGPEGIRLGYDPAGRPFLSLQQTILDLYHRGILLAICSKNNETDVLPILNKHPAMLLRPQHFAAMRINWDDKASNLRSIADELNVGSDSVVLLDDNPAERLQVRLMAPEIKVLEVSEDPISFAAAVRDFPGFDRLSISEEDRRRNRIYTEQRSREQLREKASSLEEYLNDLRTVIEPRTMTSQDLSRVTQLIHKTNQFNLTTHRYTEAQIEELAKTLGCRINTFRVSDRFGQSGLVGVAITRDRSGVCEIDTLLLSCRVIGRGVETSILSRLAEQARIAGCSRMRGMYRPTGKNNLVAGFYSKHGFEKKDTGSDGTIFYDLDLKTSDITKPEWITWSTT